MRGRTVLTACILISLYAWPAFAELPKDGGKQETVDSLERAIREAKDNKEEALLRGKLGDYYASREDYKKASDEYIKALALDPSGFNEQQRLHMALMVSWADRLDEATDILRSILADDPEFMDARIELAKVLSWSDNLREAEVEADAVLKDHPENQEALTIKANVLRWRGDAATSIPFYKKALAQGESVDARIGLTYAYLATGETDKARAESKTLKPVYEYQAKELEKLSAALCEAEASQASIQYSYYRDSDDNRVNRVGLTYGFHAGILETELAYRWTDAQDPERHEKADQLRISAHTRAGDLTAGAAAGMTFEGWTSAVLEGQVNVEKRMGWWSAGVMLSRDALTDTAQLIQNRIRKTSGTVSLSETASPRITLTENYIYSGYSDNNDSNDLRLGARYAIPFAPLKISAGYQFRYWNFKRQSGSGYFDPNDFVSNLASVSLYAEKMDIYAYLEPFIGYESFTRYGAKSAKGVFGVSGSAGLRMQKCRSLEINFEGGNYAGGSTAGFNYYQIGLNYVVHF